MLRTVSPVPYCKRAVGVQCNSRGGEQSVCCALDHSAIAAAPLLISLRYWRSTPTCVFTMHTTHDTKRSIEMERSLAFYTYACTRAVGVLCAGPLSHCGSPTADRFKALETNSYLFFTMHTLHDPNHSIEMERSLIFYTCTLRELPQ